MTEKHPVKAESVPFRFHPRVFASLGADLVTSDLVAVIELVKNCYDAFATRVDVRFKTGADGKLSLEIEDDGMGMTDSTIRDVWCVVATPFREDHATSTRDKKQRRVSGAKGLGRLSAARLGEAMQVITKTKGDKCWQVDVSWGGLASAGSMEACYAYLAECDEKALRNGIGTLVRITGLYGEWTDDMVTDLEEGLSRLKPPFSKLGDFKIYITPPGSNARATEIEPSKLINSPTYLVKGSYSENGFLKYEYNYKGLDGRRRSVNTPQSWRTVKDDIARTPQRYQPRGEKPRCGPFNFEIRAWDLDKDSVELASGQFKMQKSQIRTEIRTFKGLSVYRDQILVLPKSETARDWLGLDLRRVSKVGTRISTSQIVGYVGITGDANPDIEDTSDRERFVQNDAAKEFQVLLYHVIEALEMERDQDREPVPQNPLDIFSGISASDIVSEARRAKAQGADAEEIIALVEGFDRKLEGTRKAVEQHFTYYSRLATLGTLAAMLVHEIGNKRLYIQSFVEAVHGYLSNPGKGTADVRKTLRYAEEALSHLQRLAQVFYPLAARSYKRGRRTASISATVEMCRTAQEKLLSGRRIEWKVELKGQDEVKVDPAELHAVLQNLVDNAVYWLGRKEDGEKKLVIETRRSPIVGRVQVLIHDSGIGVADEDRERIFDPGYTRRPNGAGMGLTVAGEIISQHEGKLRLAPRGRFGGGTFDFTLPASE